jgi:hypothetical protein
MDDLGSDYDFIQFDYSPLSSIWGCVSEDFPEYSRNQIAYDAIPFVSKVLDLLIDDLMPPPQIHNSENYTIIP